jgi:hypothetical protein
MHPKSMINFLLAIIIGAAGLFNIIEAPFDMGGKAVQIVLSICLLVGGILLFVDSMHMITFQMPSIILGIITLAIGAINMLFNIGILGFDLSFLPAFVYGIIYIVIGIFLLIGGFVTL